MTVYSTPEGVERSCTGKKRYDNEEHAARAIAGIWQRFHVAEQAYPCFRCGGFHLTKRGAEKPNARGWRPAAKSFRARQRERKARRRRR